MHDPTQTIGITGSTGFVGSHLVRSLSSDGHHIKAFGRTSFAPQLLEKYAKYHQWDITKVADASKVGNADIFIHAAGFVDFWGSKNKIYGANVIGIENAIKLAQKMGAKAFIYISSASVYDSRTDKINIKESAPYANSYLNYYAQTKVDAETLLSKAQGFDSIVIIRPHAIYGPGDRTIIPQILRRIRNHRIILTDSGNSLYSVTHVGNIVDAVRCIIKTSPPGFNILNITDSKPIQVKSFLGEIISRHDPEAKIITLPFTVGLFAAWIIESWAIISNSKNAPLLTRNIMYQLHHESTMSIEHAKKLIGYQAKHSYPEGLNDTFEWLNKNSHPKVNPSWSEGIRIY